MSRMSTFLLTALLAAPVEARAAQATAPSPVPTASPEATPHDGWVARKVRFALTDHEPGSEGLHWWLFYPAASIPSAGSGPGARLHLWAPDIHGSLFDVHASAAYSWYGYQFYDLQFGALPHRARHKPEFTTGTDSIYPMSDLYRSAGIREFDLFVNIHHRRFPRDRFFGLGPGSREEDRSDYRISDTLGEVVGEYRVTSWMTLSARAGLLKTSLGSGNDAKTPDTQVLFDDETAPGLVRQPDYGQASLGVLIDTRDEPFNPHRGGAIGVALTRYDEWGGSEFQFNRLTVDARRFIGLGHGRRHVIAVRAGASFDDPDEGSRVPFYLQSGLGGNNLLRGFRPFRFRDEDLLAMSGEYRFDLRPKIELAAFYDAGKVFRTIGNLDLKNLATSWGVGLRLKTETKVKLRLDLAHSREGTRVLIKFAPAF